MNRIVVLQESLDFASVVRHQLESDGYEVFLAHSPDDTWKHVVFEPPEALIVDVKIPGAWELLERIRGDARVCRLPVIVLTSVMEDEAEIRAGRLFSVFIPRPFSASSLEDRIRQAKTLSSDLSAPAGYIQTKQIHVTLLVGDGLRVEGTVHLAPEFDRFSEGWEGLVHDPREFIPLTEAQVTSRDGGDPIVVSPFLEVRKSDVLTVIPRVRELTTA